MKKRILCAFLALMMLISLVPVTAMNASAASRTTSEAAIKFIKQYESYSKTCHADGTRYSIGYGTKCDGDHTGGTKHTITEVEASAALAKELPAIEAKINGMGLNLSQNQFDALVSFSYNNGTAWISGSGIFKNAVMGGKTGNEFVYAISLWSNAHEGFSSGLMNRRLAEANMYLNGVYTKEKPTNYTYVLFDANGGTLTNSMDSGSYKMQGYITGGSVAIKASAVKEGYVFLGWYNAKGEPVNALTTALAGQTLTARWQDAKNPTASTVNYTMNTNSFTSLQPLADHKDGASSTGFPKLAADTVVNVVAEFMDTNGTRWVRIKDNGWVKISAPAVEEEKTPVGAGTVVTVTNAYINVRKEPSASSAQNGKVNYGDKLTLQDVVSNNGALWGKIDKGWIALMYTNYDAVKVEVKPEAKPEDKPAEDKVIATAVIKCEDDSFVNVRKGAGVGNTAVSSLRNGAKVELFEITTVDGHEWGRISSGWFCLDYATVEEVKEETDKTPEQDTEKEETPAETVVATGTVISNTALNVRNGAGVNHGIVASKVKGTALNIYEITSVNGHEWGRIGADQWVCLTYVNYTLTEVKEETTPEAPVTTGLFNGTANIALNVRAEAKVGGEKIAEIKAGDKVSILEVVAGYDADGTTRAAWGKVQVKDSSDKLVTGWICVTNNVALEPAYFTVISNTLNVRSTTDSSNKSNIVDKLSKGTVVEISNLTFTTDTSMWGYSKDYKGWMCISANYMERTYTLNGGTTTPEGDSSTDPVVPGAPSTPVVPTGILATGVVNGVQLNVRSTPGFNGAKVNTLQPNSEINIYEYVVADGMAWGRTDYGWVSLGYVLITSTGVTGHGQKATVANSYIGVNVRHEATTNSTLLTKILVNSRIEILDQKTVNGTNWGRTTLGWVSMEYVLLDSDAGVDMDDLLGGGVIGGTTTTPEGSGTTTPTTPANAFAYAAVATANAKLYKSAGSGETSNSISNGQSVTVYEIAVDTNGTKWVRVDEGWVEAASVKLNAVKQVYTVVSNSLNVRSSTDSSSKSNIVGKLTKNTVVEVTELAMSDASVWGKVSYTNDKEETITGYICLGASYVAVGDVSVKEETPAPETNPGTSTPPTTDAPTTNKGGILYTGTIKIWDGTAAKVKVRETAGGKEIDTLSPGVKVNIVDIQIVNNMPWGKCGAGWICLTYVDLVPYKSTAQDAKVILYTDNSYSVPVYDAADGVNKIGTLAKGAVVDILEVNGQWVRTTQGWIQSNCLAPC